jgi:hypothetical protein
MTAKTKSARNGKAKTKSASGGAGARIFDLLRTEHEEALEMIEEICDSGAEMEDSERMEKFETFRAALMSHSNAEARAFYAPLKEAASEPHPVLEADVEHLVVQRLLEDLSSPQLDVARWMARATVVKELLEHHIEEEEGELFELAQAECDEETLAKMADDFEVEKARLMEIVA